MFIIVFLCIVLILIANIYELNIKNLKKIKQFGEKNEKLDEIVNKYPSNIDICKYMLKMIDNQSVEVEENKEYKNSLYIAISNKIIIANIENSFTRIQTIAHECLHSIQNRKKLRFNFVYSNIYLLYFIIVAILGIFNLINNEIIYLFVFAIMGYLYYFIRSYLEDDAMIKAKYIAKEYMEEMKISTKEEIDFVINTYNEMYEIGVPFTNSNLIIGTIIKTIILTIIFLI